MALVDITGKKFGRLTVNRLDPSSSKVMFWFCDCDCGAKEVRACGGDLKRGQRLSCGCQQREKHLRRITKHGMYRHPAYKTWQSMRDRCLNTRSSNFYLYGARGISVTQEWDLFEAFWADMGSTWADGLSLDRIDVNGNYDPGNCRWATPKEQSGNRRDNHMIGTPFGLMNVSAAARAMGFPENTLRARLRYGWPDEDLFLPKISRHSIRSRQMSFDHLRFPMTRFHPVLGKRTADTHDDLDKVFVGPEHNWFETPEEADMHRTAADAAMVLHNSVRMRVDAIASEGDPDSETPDLAEQTDIGTVVNSVQHQEYVVKPLLEAPTAEEQQAQADRVEEAAQKRRDDLAQDAHVESPAG